MNAFDRFRHTPLFLSCYVVIPAQRESASVPLKSGIIEHPVVNKSEACPKKGSSPGITFST
jgi:hypothetical protein